MYCTHPTISTSTFRLFLALWGLLLLSIPATARELSIQAQLDRKEIQLGDHAMLDVTISGDNNASVSLPEVEGLDIQHQGSSTQMQIVNGNVSSQVSHRYLVTPSKTGAFTIPPLTIRSKGQQTKTQNNLTLQVTKGPPPGQADQQDTGELAFLEIIGLKDQAIVGELMPVEIRAYFKDGVQVSLDSMPALDGSSFIMKLQDDRPRQGRINIDGTNYSVIVFRSSISPIKAGEFDLSFNVGATLHIEDRSRQQRNRRPGNLRGSPFGNDPFSSFFTPRIRKKVQLASEVHPITVTPPPSDGQPEQFDGTVGTFALSARSSTRTVRAGDPITLQVKVTGKGDLDRVPMPHFSAPSGWKTYPAKSQIKQQASANSDGTKIFEQIIVPKNESVSEIPALELNYYDPVLQSYQTARTEPIPITVTPGTNIVDQATAAYTSSSNDSAASAPTTDVPHSQLGGLRQRRIDQTPWLMGAIAGLIAVFITSTVLAIWQRKHNTTERKAKTRREKGIQSCLDEMNQAVTQDDAALFFAAAKRALQTQWSHSLGIAPEAVSGTDLPVHQAPSAKTVFDAADSIAFSGDSQMPVDWEYWQRETLSALDSLKTSKPE